MKLLSFYEWLAGSENDFLQQFQNNENLYVQAQTFWSQLDGTMVFIFGAMVVIGLLGVSIYYGPYNNVPGRHYKVRHWLLFLGITFGLTLIVSGGIEHLICEPELDGASALEWRVALANALYAGIFYCIVSLIWCNFLPTNAYRWLKLRKS